MKTKLVLIQLLSIICIISAIAQSTPIAQFYASGFSQPLGIVNASDGSDRLFIVEKGGTVKILDSNGILISGNFLNISSKVSTNGERGLLGLAFHPDYINNGYFYVNYTNTAGDTRIARYQVSAADPNVADPTSEKIMISVNQPAWNHNAGDLKFGADGYLYIPLGDGGGAANCGVMDGDNFLGKILRIDVNENMNAFPYYGIPADNPYVGDPDWLDEIWASGLRNPWRFSFDRSNGDMWLADVGQNAWEEVNYQPANSVGGQNYGWSMMEGAHCYSANNCPLNTAPCNSSAYTNPIFEYSHSSVTGGASIVGGYVYRGCELPGLQGYYLCADTYSQNLWTVLPNGVSTKFSTNVGNIISFGEDEFGELYLASFDNNIYRVIAENNIACVGCPTNRYEMNTVAPGVYQAANTVYSDGVISSALNTTFYGNYIELNPGFQSNMDFIAEINPCSQ